MDWQPATVNLVQVVQGQAHLLHVAEVGGLVRVWHFADPDVVSCVVVVVGDHSFGFFQAEEED